MEVIDIILLTIIHNKQSFTDKDTGFKYQPSYVQVSDTPCYNL